jgi:arylsulfatase A-like enzyme
MPKLSRREFLKLAGMAGTLALSRLPDRLLDVQNQELPNIVIFVFDSMSARDLSLYGFKRGTTPNLEKFAEQATVYHSHHSSGNFTTPGTASLLTGTYPWTHRAFNVSGLIERNKAAHNIFKLLEGKYHRFAFSQNLLPNYFFGQFAADIETVLPSGAFSAFDHVVGGYLRNDTDLGYRAFDNFLFQESESPGSLLFGIADRILRYRWEVRNKFDEYPRGLPIAGDDRIMFRLGEVFEGVQASIQELQAHSPYFAYIHLWAPHSPYRPSIAFDEYFQDKYRPIKKPDHRLGDHLEYYRLNNRRQNYDEFVANVDHEFGRLMDQLKAEGTLDNTCIIVTSDHGESFERGVEGHMTKLLYEPLIHIPLLISTPSQKNRRDIYSPTNSVDLVPTLLKITGHEVPDWVEGEPLPGFGGVEDMQRSIFTLEAKTNRAHTTLTRATVAMVKGNHKMIHYRGYEEQDTFELYDLANDYEELEDLSQDAPSFGRHMKEELFEKLDSVNRKYEKS